MKRLFLIAFLAVLSLTTSGKTAFYLENIATGEIIVNENDSIPLKPASVLKIVTAASLLSLADENEQFVTPVIITGKLINDTVLNGDVVVMASGDPTLESRHFPQNRGFIDSVAAAVKNLGIKIINGKVTVDESSYPARENPIPGWTDADLTDPYGAQWNAANYADNTFKLTLPSQKTSPLVPDLKINRKNARSKSFGLSRKRDTDQFTVTGNKAHTGYYAMTRPALTIEAELTKALKKDSIILNDSVNPSLPTLRMVYTHLSPTYKEIMRSMLFRSDNLMAQGMMRAIAPRNTSQAAIKEEIRVWDVLGIPIDSIKIEDGSGLSRGNRITAAFLAAVLRTMAPEGFASYLPRVGQEGTVKRVLPDAKVNAVLKSGTLRGVKTYAGYLLDDDNNPTHIVVYLNNDWVGSDKAKKDFQKRLISALNRKSEITEIVKEPVTDE